MPEAKTQITPEIREQMHVICRTALSNREDADRVGDELFGHLEDKLFAYLRGDERLTEADAMILVREHFGKPEALGALLGQVHREIVAGDDLSFSRKLLVAGVALALVNAVAWICYPLVNLLQARLMFEHWSLDWNLRTSVSISVAATAAFYLLARRWGRRTRENARSVFRRWHPGFTVACIFAICIVQIVATRLIHWRMPLPAAINPGLSNWFVWSISVLSFGTLAVQCALWIGLTAGGARWLTVMASAGGWLALTVVVTLLSTLTNAFSGESRSSSPHLFGLWLVSMLSVTLGGVLLVALHRAARRILNRAPRIRLAWSRT